MGPRGVCSAAGRVGTGGPRHFASPKSTTLIVVWADQGPPQFPTLREGSKQGISTLEKVAFLQHYFGQIRPQGKSKDPGGQAQLSFERGERNQKKENRPVPLEVEHFDKSTQRTGKRRFSIDFSKT